MDEKFEEELRALINKHSIESEFDIPDFILAAYLMATLKALRGTVQANAEWGRV